MHIDITYADVILDVALTVVGGVGGIIFMYTVQYTVQLILNSIHVQL